MERHRKHTQTILWLLTALVLSMAVALAAGQKASPKASPKASVKAATTARKAPPAPKIATLGQPAPAFVLPNVATGAPTSLNALRQGKKAAVVMFIATRCPVSNAYNERMAALAGAYRAKGVAFVGINANHNESVAECRSHAQEHRFPFPVLKDETNRIADAYDARVTPETYVINAGGLLVYHGRIDNSDDPSEVKTHDLATAVDSVLAGRPVAKARTKAFGCSIKRAGG